MNLNAVMVCQHDTPLVVLSILMPHGHFCLWTPGLGWLHVFADALIVLAYFSVPIAFVYFVRNRKDITFAWMFVCLGIFILAGGATHLMEIWNARDSHYSLTGAIKALAALASVPTVILLARLVPATQALRASEERMRAVLESALDCIVTMDHHGRVVEFNPAAEKTFGYKRDATIGRLMADLIIPPALRERHGRGLAHYLSTGKAALLGQRIELTGMRSDHSEFPVELAITRVGSHEPPMFTGFIRDITERKEAEKALAEQALRYKTLMETSTDSIYVMDEKGDLQEANASFLRRRGYTAAEVKGFNVADWDAQWSPEQLQEKLRKLVGGSAVFETRHRCKDGSVFDVEVCATSVRIGGEQLFFVVTREITERKLAEEALRDSEERFRELAENINEVFWVWTATPGNARCLYASPAYTTIWGRSCESLYSSPKSWREALHPQDKEWVLEEIARLDLEKINDWTYRIVRPDQSIRWIRDRIFPVRDEDGVVVRFAGIAEDITEPKQTAEAQERALSLMLATLESTADGVLVVNNEGKIVTFNRLFARMWRLSDEVLASKEDAHALDYVLDQLNEPKKFLEKVRYLYQHSGEESFDRLVFKDGRVFERYSRPQLIGGRVAGRVWSFRDATERTQAAKELEEANDKLRLLSRRLFDAHEEERRHLARELHDEIGQALTAAKINLESIESIESSAQSLRLKETSNLLDNLLRQVRQISLDLHSSLLDDLGLAPALRSLLDQQARRAGLRARFHAAEPLASIDPEIQTTGFRIAQEAITNVLRHAKARSVGLHLRIESGRLRIKIVDDGSGFDLAEVERHSHQEESFGLMGMRERAALVGGHVQIISSLDKGTTIEVSLPLTPRLEDQSRQLGK